MRGREKHHVDVDGNKLQEEEECCCQVNGPTHETHVAERKRKRKRKRKKQKGKEKEKEREKERKREKEMKMRKLLHENVESWYENMQLV